MTTNILSQLLAKLLPFPLYLLTSKKISQKLTEQNRTINDRLPAITEPITDQHTAQIQSFRYGRYSASYNGCAAIALFNAFLSQNRAQPLPLLIWLLETSGCLALNGKLGTNPYRLNRVLKNYPIQFTRYKALSKLEAALAPGDTAILCIWNDKNDLRKGAHFFTAIRQPKGYAVYNRLAPLPEPCSLASIIGKGKLIISYRLF